MPPSLFTQTQKLLAVTREEVLTTESKGYPYLVISQSNVDTRWQLGRLHPDTQYEVTFLIEAPRRSRDLWFPLKATTLPNFVPKQLENFIILAND